MQYAYPSHSQFLSLAWRREQRSVLNTALSVVLNSILCYTNDLLNDEIESMLTLWHFLNSDRGGVARYVEQVVVAQIEMNSSRVMRVMSSPRLQLPAAVKRDTYVPLNNIWGFNQWQFAFSSWQLIQRTPHTADTILHTHNFTFATPDVHTVHGFYGKNWSAKYRNSFSATSPRSWVRFSQYFFLSRLELHMLKISGRVVFLSQENRAYAENILNLRRPSNFCVITPGVDAKQFNPALRSEIQINRRKIFPHIDPDSRWLLIVANDFWGKGLLRILENLVQIDASWSVLVFGEDRQHVSDVEALAQRARRGKVHIFASDKNLYAAYGLSDFLIMDSVSEGFPLVLLEAMASGCVPLVTAFGGVTDVITSQQNGMILKDAKEIACSALTLDDSTRSDLSRQAVQTARLRTWRKVAEEYEDVYSSLRREK